MAGYFPVDTEYVLYAQVADLVNAGGPRILGVRRGFQGSESIVASGPYFEVKVRPWEQELGEAIMRLAYELVRVEKSRRQILNTMGGIALVSNTIYEAK